MREEFTTIKEEVTGEEIKLYVTDHIYKPYYALEIADGYFVRAYNTQGDGEICIIFDKNGYEKGWLYSNDNDKVKRMLLRHLFPTLAYAKEYAGELNAIYEDMKEFTKDLFGE